MEREEKGKRKKSFGITFPPPSPPSHCMEKREGKEGHIIRSNIPHVVILSQKREEKGMKKEKNK